jgi:hypothetical protein
MEKTHASGEVPDPQRGVRERKQEVRPMRQECLARWRLESLESHAVELEETAFRSDPEHAIRALSKASDGSWRPVPHRPRGVRQLRGRRRR